MEATIATVRNTMTMTTKLEDQLRSMFLSDDVCTMTLYAL